MQSEPTSTHVERNWLQEMEKKRAVRDRSRLLLVSSEQVEVDQRKSHRSSRLPSSKCTNGTSILLKKPVGHTLALLKIDLLIFVF
jgi:hypothetical protein